jgi:hypothetical protein
MCLATLAFVSTGVFAQTASSKATAAINTAVYCTSSASTSIGDTLPVNCHDIFSGASVPTTPDNFVPAMSATVKVSNSQSLFVSASMVTGLYTNTRTKTSPGTSSTASAFGGVYERAVLLDGNGNIVATAYPVAACSGDILGCQQVGAQGYGVVLDSRLQTLTQSLSDCVVTVGTTSGSCSFSLTTDLILNTTSAHTFNFIFPNVGQGTYTVQIQDAVNTSATQTNGTAVAGAAFGLGSVTIESVRMVHDFSF